VSGDVASFRNNPRLGTFLIFYAVGCTVPGLTLTGPSGIGLPRFTWTNIPLSKSLKFRVSSRHDVDLGQGLRDKGTATVKGKISRSGRGSGTFSDSGVITNAAGQQLGQCASGKISWKVRRKK